MNRQWTAAEANEWYKTLGWLRGCNFIGSDCANRLDMFQNHKHEEKLATAERELALAQKIGFNTVRIWSNFDVYYAEPDSYMEILDRYIDLCGKYGQKVMILLGHEEDLPRGETFIPKKMGEQAYALGVHQGRLPMDEAYAALEPRHYMEYPELHDLYTEMVLKTVRKYKNDPRVFCFNIWNEPGITIGNRSIPLIRELFDLVRAEDPDQPLCADVWRGLHDDGTPHYEAEAAALELSDVISYHSYLPFVPFVEGLEKIQLHNRPIFLTEWLHRIDHNDVEQIYPLLYLENVANYCWGFVVGKTQTNEPWDWMWEEYDKGNGDQYDFTRWQHDLFRPNLRPYDPKEIAIIKRFNDLADKRRPPQE